MQLSWQDALTCLQTPVLADAFLACRAVTMTWMVVGSDYQSTGLHASIVNRIALEAKISAYRALSVLATKYQQQHAPVSPAMFRAPIFLFWAEIAVGDTEAASKHCRMLEYLEDQASIPGSEISCSWKAEKKSISLESRGGTWYTGGNSNVKRGWNAAWEA